MSSSPLTAAHHASDGKRHLLLAASGSVASIKLPPILSSLSQTPNLSIRLILTSSASNFLSGQSPEQPSLTSLTSIPNVDGIYLDADEWVTPWTRGGPILHIELRRWADILVIAPLSANTMAKMVNGIADNLLLSVVRAWDTTGEIEGREEAKRIVVAPAMNTAMWKHPVTAKQMQILEQEWGVGRAGTSDSESKSQGWIEVLCPIEKELACGDTGAGAMREWSEIVEVIKSRLALS